MIYGMYTDCSALGEEARELCRSGYLESKEVRMKAKLPAECERVPGSA
jgi:hypothetical protein